MFRCDRGSVILIAVFFFLSANAFAQSHFKVLHLFDGKGEGAKYPGNIVMDGSGNLFGITTQGGDSACSSGCGVVYELSPSGSEWTYKFVYGFKGAQRAWLLHEQQVPRHALATPAWLRAARNDKSFEP